ncbi:MAG: hypothetical protein LBI28_03380 [Treponema sp.]|jgi:hypothetical protein|nr:hypothetical protein [Treponema sp.]
MKNSQLALFSGIIFVLAAVLLLSACDGDIESLAFREPFFGTWICDDDPARSITISADKIVYRDEGSREDSKYYNQTVSELEWIRDINRLFETGRDYPLGYSIFGYVSAVAENSNYNVGNSWRDSFFINRECDKLVNQSSYDGRLFGVYTKVSK